MIRVVIPACNEQTVIGRCLNALLADALQGEFQVVVVCNGCTDGTAELARSYGRPVAVLETSVRSKTHALNLGDQFVQGFPRLYVDADVVLSTSSARAMAKALEQGALAAAPTLILDTSGSSQVVLSYLRIWEQLPVIRNGLVGRGVYGLSEAGRGRFNAFPDVIGDDYFVHGLFAKSDLSVVKNATSIVRTPHTVRDLIQRKTRSYVGMLLGAEGSQAPRTSVQWIGVVARDRRRILDLPAYLGVSFVSKLKARRQVKAGKADEWNRDLSTRQG